MVNSIVTDAEVFGVFGAFYWVNCNGKVLKAKLSGKIKESDKQFSRQSILAIGDKVKVELSPIENDDIEAYILTVEPRKNLISRANFHKLQIFAANIDRLVVVASLRAPKIFFGFIDRVLVEAELNYVDVIIVMNKFDLREETDSAVICRFQKYENLGYKIFYENFTDGVSESLSVILHHGRSLLIGLSGVGKSTLLNSLAGKPIQTVNEVSQINKGRHTTTNPVLYQLKNNGELIDIPGVREFGLMHLQKKDISRGYREMKSIQCRFDDCLHIDEPDCLIKNGVGKVISKSRYNSYLSILASLSEKFKPRRGDYRL